MRNHVGGPSTRQLDFISHPGNYEFLCPNEGAGLVESVGWNRRRWVRDVASGLPVASWLARHGRNVLLAYYSYHYC